MTQSAMNMPGAARTQAQQQPSEGQQGNPNTPTDVIANAASQTKGGKRGVYAAMKQAVSPYVEGHSHAVVYGVVGFIIAALILLVGFWPTVLLVLFAAIGAVIGRYRDGDDRTRQAARNLFNRMN